MDKSATLYNGEVTIDFREKRHVYTVSDSLIDSGAKFKPPSVTQVLKWMDKPALPQWSANQTCEFIRERWESGYTYTQKQIDAILNLARFAHKEKAKTAAVFGTAGHAYLEGYIRAQMEFGSAPELPEDAEAREACWQATQWLDKNVEEFIGCELLLYSRRLQIAATCDVMAKFKSGQLALFDWKFAKGLWPEYRFQTAAYTKFYEECYGARPEQRWLLWWDKNEQKFKPTLLPAEDIDADFETFLGLKAVQKRMKQLKDQD